MKLNLIILLIPAFLLTGQVKAQKAFDFTVNTTKGELLIKVLGHASVVFEWNNLLIYVDPYSKAYDFSGMTKADIILITHQDDDHFDATAIGQLKKDSTLMIYTSTCKGLGKYSGRDTIMAKGDSIYMMNLVLKAVPAYNIVKSKHLKGVGNGYIITFGDKRIYLAGDTEVIPEMSSFRDIDIAFLGYSVLNMDTNMFLEAIAAIQPTIVIPYHYDNSNITQLIEAVGLIQGVTLLTESPITSIGQIDTRDKNILYPNPTNKILFGNMFEQNSVISIFNSSGRLITFYRIQNNGAIDVSYLSSGVYIFSVTGAERTLSGRFTVKR
jgi:L-ascorbate metabolism protein UlaG (beta-lactamase superfamily)